MTYCAALQLSRGLVFMSDTRTNAGLDNVSVFRKMFSWEKPGERLITLLAAGNLATTQAVVNLIQRDLDPEIDDKDSETKGNQRSAILPLSL